MNFILNFNTLAIILFTIFFFFSVCILVYKSIDKHTIFRRSTAYI